MNAECFLHVGDRLLRTGHLLVNFLVNQSPGREPFQVFQTEGIQYRELVIQAIEELSCKTEQ